MKRIYGLNTEWSEEVYSELLATASAFGSHCIMVVRSPRSKTLDVIHQLDRWLVTQWTGQQWPGTQLLEEGGQAELYKFKVTSEFIEVLKGISSSLWDWNSPRLPEDISFLRTDGSPWFISIIHEKDAYFKLEDEELAFFEARFGVGALVDEGEDTLPQETY